ncbi:MAG: 30S ribosomal protein S3 [Candidatus Magasanikbacteria bacterium]
MGNKTRPDSYRLGQPAGSDWSSHWFYKKSRKYFLKEDCLIREHLQEDLSNAGIDEIEIERTRDDINVKIHSNRPGLVIGRKGSRIQSLRDELTEEIRELRKEYDQDLDFGLNLNVVELKRNEVSSQVIADQVASDLERRLPYRRAMKRRLGSLEKNREVEGARIQVAGRLNGADFARTEWIDFGSMPLNTLRADIDYGESTAYTTFGTIGVKAWIYKGEVFEEEQEDENE